VKQIPFNTEEVRATLDGRKSVTRRPVKVWVIEFERVSKEEVLKC